MRNIKVKILIALAAVFLPILSFAATFSFEPGFGNFTQGQSFVSSVYIVPANGESISAAKMVLNYPADKLELVSYNPVQSAPGFNLFAHVGIKTSTPGIIEDNVAFNPALTAKTKIATVTFKVKGNGAATVSVSNDSKLLDQSNSDKKVTPLPSASYTLLAPQPKPQTQTKPKTQSKPKPKTQAKPKTKPAGSKATPSKKEEKKEELATSTATTTASSTEQVATTTATTSQEEKIQKPEVQNAGKQLAATGILSYLWWILALAAVILLGAIIWLFGFKRK